MMHHAGDLVVNVLNGCVGRVLERWGPSNNPFYRDYRVQFNYGQWVIKERHLRLPLPGERRRLK